MNSLILRTAGPLVAAVMVLFSLIVLLRGHNDPGGGFIAGLIAASASAILGMARGVGPVRRMLRVNPIGIAALGVGVSLASGLVSAFAGVPFLTGIWLSGNLFGTPGLFDIGVYLAVFGTVSAVTLALEDTGEAS